MRSFFALVALVSAAAAVFIPPHDIRDDNESTESIVASLTASNHFGAPNAPQVAGATPGWYFGDDPASADGLPWLKDPDLCASLAADPTALHCPAGTAFRGTYYEVFYGLNASIQAPDYMTFGLVDTVSDCETMCDSVTGCNFINPYHDVNGKDGSPLLTCSLYSQFHTAADADNFGGQTQSDGSIDFITDSAGYDRTGP
ncbi:hypothetical protein GYMLUDRAFT_177527 [Collybiopsis luxurians FD-317 M1]|uniref:Apple domain-containing protein n=1 Tax=Collybiopsis luxurians FD-317 M1 TaxID=944289 RepID=A0A0D0CHA4_9AGAR|nr:hypothetical protein GYMLUDRAFT_177527 [Collybiopsis luxurians FD-317 M1]